MPYLDTLADGQQTDRAHVNGRSVAGTGRAGNRKEAVNVLCARECPRGTVPAPTGTKYLDELLSAGSHWKSAPRVREYQFLY